MGFAEIRQRTKTIACLLRRFGRERGGNVAILFGLSLLPVGAMVGVALDYNRAIDLRGFAHRETDAAALAIATSDSPNSDAVIDALKSRLTAYYGAGSGMVQDISVSMDWVGSSVVTLRTSVKLATTLTKLLPNTPTQIPLQVVSSVKRKPAVWQWTLPTIKDLSYEAADYNRLSVYCYDESEKGTATKGRRLETLTAISDNGGTDYSRVTMPTCDPGETLSYQLRNVRNSRTTRANWDKASAEHYLYYTDTTIDPSTRVAKQNVSGGREYSDGSMSSINVTDPAIAETILCTTLTDCKARSLGGILPNDNVGSHDPQKATGACTEGKSMYYGWEDRPPSAGGSDRDYNDIRIVVSCPSQVKVSDKEVRIIK